MTDQTTRSPDTGPDDPFERDLRALLHDRAAGPVPAGLRARVTGVVDAPPVAPRGWVAIVRSLGTIAALLVVGIVGVQVLAPRGGGTGGTGASPSASPPPAIVWDTGTVRMTADSLRITAGGLAFTAQVPDVQVHGDPGGRTYRSLEMMWQEQDREQRLHLYLAADDVSWWVTEVRTRDGHAQAEWITYPPPPFRVAIGGTWSGDLRLSAPGGTLEVQGMTLQAFSPDSFPDSLEGCRPAGRPGSTDPLADGQPLAGTGIERMTPAGAKQVLLGLGFCHTFRYGYEFTDGSGGGYSEIWCDPPPGRIMELTYGSDGEVIVFVVDATPQQHSPRPQPPVGWGC